MPRVRPLYGNYRRPIPEPDAVDADVLAYTAAHEAWVSDRLAEGDLGAVTSAEAEPGHVEAVERALALQAQAQGEA